MEKDLKLKLDLCLPLQSRHVFAKLENSSFTVICMSIYKQDVRDSGVEYREIQVIAA